MEPAIRRRKTDRLRSHIIYIYICIYICIHKRIYGNRGELDEITGTSAWRQADPRDGIKFSFGARSRVTNYRHRARTLARGRNGKAPHAGNRFSLDGFPVWFAARASVVLDSARRCPATDDCKPNNGALKIHGRRPNFIRDRGN